MQFADGGWNCRKRNYPETIHSSFHTTFNVLEGLREAASVGNVEAGAFRKAEGQAIEFMLQHQMARSDKTGEIINERFLHLAYPSHWHYTVLRGLDYIRTTSFIGDDRLTDALDRLEGRRSPLQRWPVEKPIPGSILFSMEKNGQPSRWNTLRAMRVLRAAGRA
jgi:hypothetical protein